MEIIEGRIENLYARAVKYDFLKNSGKQAVTSAALGAAVGSAALASQAVLLSNSKWDVKDCDFELNGQHYEGIFENIYFPNDTPAICLIQDNIALVIIDPNDNKMYIPIGTGESMKQLRKKYKIMFLGLSVFAFIVSISIARSYIEIIIMFLLFMFISFFLVWSMYKPEEPQGILTEEMLKLLGFKNIGDVNLNKYGYIDKNRGRTMSWVIRYQDAFKENNPYPADYFGSK